ncbi:lytic transglycosylase domain-containing protein [Alkalicoccobacillus murimartini]|uniref:Soluble lytic murein transglycosylase-like protein n=1 Tax=Alkalicoccobacillus murimartini TaxID=171685 RepID=A0ABT9YK64_9BACI|nr:lytic transglycosylase domain-containing protein [Alkalicoccobacillus murimartini]MDQ0207885.1 soluble lytic murein transglycosylase-like protein [Alkalicoccobacillus murimartini]
MDYALLKNQLFSMRNQTQLSWANKTNITSPNAEDSFSSILSSQLSSQTLQPSSSGLSDLFLSQAAREKFESLQNQISTSQKTSAVESSKVEQQTSVKSSKGSTPFDDLIQGAAKKFSLDPKLLYAVIKNESNFNPNAKSHAGASGLMQLMPATAKGLGVKDIFNPEQNIQGGAKYLKSMLTKYNGDIEKALAAYNAGPGNVDKYNGIPPFKETRAYVPKVLNTYHNA